jgi:hypothetical protein
MNNQQWTALGVVLGLVGVTAALLAYIGASQRLGNPGLKLVDEPTYMADVDAAKSVTNRVAVRMQSAYLPTEVLEYTSQIEDITPLEINWLPKDTLFGRRRYHSKDGFDILTSVVLMGLDRTSIHKPQFCLEGQGWRIGKAEIIGIPIARPHPYELKVMKLTTSKQLADRSGKPRTATGFYLYWFVADNLLTASHGERMWWMARDLVRTGVLQRWAYVSYFAACWAGPDEQATLSRLQELIAASVPEFQLATGPAPGAGAGSMIAPSSDFAWERGEIAWLNGLGLSDPLAWDGGDGKRQSDYLLGPSLTAR